MTAENLSKATGIDAKYLLISPELREQIERATHAAYQKGKHTSCLGYFTGPPWGEPDDFVAKVGTKPSSWEERMTERLMSDDDKLLLDPFRAPIDTRVDRLASHMLQHELFYMFLIGMLTGGLVSAITLWLVEGK